MPGPEEQEAPRKKISSSAVNIFFCIPADRSWWKANSLDFISLMSFYRFVWRETWERVERAECLVMSLLFFDHALAGRLPRLL